jgi:imidazolonepropionase-like amidohydrolase
VTPLVLRRSRFLFLAGLLLQLGAAASEHPANVGQNIASPIRFLNWTPPQAHPVSAFVHVNVIPMNSDQTMRDRTVVIRAGHIVTIGPAADTPVPPHALIIDGTGKYLIPGLTDMRAHVYTPGELLLYVANGVTTVRNLDGRPQHLEWRDKINAGKMFGPTILTAGPTIEAAKTTIEAKRLVMEQSRADYDAVEAGDHVSPEAFRAITATARALGVLVFGTLNANVGLKDTVSAPQFFSVERTGQFAAVLFKNNPDTPEADISAAAAEIRNAKLWFAPSLVSVESEVQQVEDLPKVLSRPEMKYLPPWARREWSLPHNSDGKSAGGEDAALLRRNLTFDKRVVSVLQREGVSMILGTDAMTGGTLPGFSVAEELANLVEAGFRPFEALQTATRNASEWFVHPEGGGVFGAITLGERADILLLDANPLSDIRNISKIRGVMVQGRWLPEEEIQRMLAALPAAYAAEKKYLTAIAESRPKEFGAYLRENDPFHKTTDEVMLDLVLAGGVKALQQNYSRLQQADPSSIVIEEATVNDLGYRLLEMNRNSDAVEVFRFNLRAHPDSAAAFDGLGRAYLKNGDRAQAIHCFQEAMRVNPALAHAHEALEQLGSQEGQK